MTSPPWDPEFLDRHPAFFAIADAAAPFLASRDWPPVEAIDRLAGPAAGVRFVPQPPRPRRARALRALEHTYDGRIALAGEVPTREGSWHDLLNALVWASFPRAKAALHARQFAALRARVGERFQRLPPSRTPEQDALALLDEGGLLVLVAGPGHGNALAALAAGQGEAIVFGHAIHEHLVAGASARACPVLLAAPERALACARTYPERRALADALLAARIADPAAFAARPTAAGIAADRALFTRQAEPSRAGTGEPSAARR